MQADEIERHDVIRVADEVVVDLIPVAAPLDMDDRDVRFIVDLIDRHR